MSRVPFYSTLMILSTGNFIKKKPRNTSPLYSIEYKCEIKKWVNMEETEEIQPDPHWLNLSLYDNFQMKKQGGREPA